MPSERETALLLRRFQGINLTQDSAFVDPSFLTKAQNWITSPTFLLSKRPGTVAASFSPITVGGTAGTIGASDALTRTYDRAGTNRYLYGVTRRGTPGPDGVWVSTNDGAAVAVTGGLFTAFGKVYGSAVLGERVYFGNGTDPIKYVAIGGSGTDYTNLTLMNGAGVTGNAQAATATVPQIDPGTYSYTWAVYNTSTQIYVRRDIDRQALTVAGVPGIQAGNFIRFTVPTTALGPNEVYRLFVAPQGLPIEFAHQQFGDQAVGAPTNLDLNVVGDGNLVPLASTITRTGKFLLAHRGRLWIAGDDTNSGANNSKVYATSTIIPGLEQTLFNLGDFFPANAVLNVGPNDGDFVTGLGIAAVTDTVSSPLAPLLIFKNHSTWALTGDILDDDSSQLIQLSSHIGCISHRTIVNTPVGTIFCGPESVYLVRPDLTIIEIGAAISSQIRAIPRANRAAAMGLYHKSFYKLCYCPEGFTSNLTQLWLDLRYGLGSAPSWWGPHTFGNNYFSWCAAQRDIAEDDRGFASGQAATIVLLDQPAIWTDATAIGSAATITSAATTLNIDNGEPFQRKILTRLRANVRASSTTTIGLNAQADSGEAMGLDPWSAGTDAAAIWDSVTDGIWDVSSWGSIKFEEVESIQHADRTRGQSFQIIMTHSDNVGMDLRDFELRYDPVERPVGAGKLS